MTARNLALEALKELVAHFGEEHSGKFYEGGCALCIAIERANAAIAALEAETGEVAAWIEPNDLAMLLKGNGREEFAGMRFAGVSDKQSKITSTALYTAPPPAVPQWLPIESAPKDGTAILLGSRCGAWIGKWKPIYTSGYQPENPWSSLMLNHDHMAEKWQTPTHFMPLPTAPGAPA